MIRKGIHFYFSLVLFFPSRDVMLLYLRNAVTFKHAIVIQDNVSEQHIGPPRARKYEGPSAIRTQIITISRKRKCLVPGSVGPDCLSCRSLVKMGASQPQPGSSSHGAQIPRGCCQTINRASLTMPISGRFPCCGRGVPTRPYLADDPWEAAGLGHILRCRSYPVVPQHGTAFRLCWSGIKAGRGRES